jgi:branched-subunit amino acid ABC-type transport system permease component
MKTLTRSIILGCIGGLLASLIIYKTNYESKQLIILFLFIVVCVRDIVSIKWDIVDKYDRLINGIAYLILIISLYFFH